MRLCSREAQACATVSVSVGGNFKAQMGISLTWLPLFSFSAFPSRRDPPNLVDMIMALNGGLWIPPTTQMNCRVHTYSNKCVQPRKVSTTTLKPSLKCAGLHTSNTCSHAQGQVCSKGTIAARGFSISSLVHALAPTSPTQT